MHSEMILDRLIKRVTAIIKNDSSGDTCRQLTNQTVDCLTEIVGSDHLYTKTVKEAASKGEKRSLSTTCGILWATKLRLDNEHDAAGTNDSSALNWRELSEHLS